MYRRYIQKSSFLFLSEILLLVNKQQLRFPEQLYLTIQLPRQTYFCLQVNKVRARFTSFVSLISVEMTCWELFFASCYDVRYLSIYTLQESQLQIHFTTPCYVSVEMTCWEYLFVKCHDVRYLSFYTLQKSQGQIHFANAPVEMTCWGIFFANCYDVNYFVLYDMLKYNGY